MGATASHAAPAAPSLPVRCGLFETIDSVTYLFTVPEYSKWAQTPAHTALNFDPFFVLGVLHHLKVYPGGFDKESAEFVGVFLVARQGPFDYVYNTKEGHCRLRMSIEILDESGERTVFDNHTAQSGQTLWGHGRGYVRFVKRSELEWSSCIRRRDDSFTLRCTVFVDVEVELRNMPAKVCAAEQMVHASKPAAGTTGASYMMTIGFFSNVKAALRTGECVHSTQFSFGGGSWYLKVYPKGDLGRGRSDETETTAEFRFEVVGLVGAREGEWLRHIFDHDNPAHGSRCFVKSSDLTLAEQMATNDDRLIIRCHLRLIKTTTASLPPTTEPPASIAVPPSDGLKHHLNVPARSPENRGRKQGA